MTGKVDITPTDGDTRADADSPGKRLLYLLLFAVIFNMVELVILLIVLFQFVSRIATGHVNARLRSLGHSLGVYLGEIVQFMSYFSDRLPFPFARWPHSETPPKWPF